MAGAAPAERSNQRYRTRKDLIAAAARLMKDGREPSLEEVAEAALVSRATAYRYFPSVETMLIEASVDIATPDIDTLFGTDATDPEARIDRAEAAMHRMAFDNEKAIRLILAAALKRSDRDDVPVRQNRRTALIEAALAPAQDRFRKAAYERLKAALALIFGSESMIVFKDVLRMDEQDARAVKSWAVRVLVRAALEDSEEKSGRGRR
jgi:AcrR family transcriptional regulator